MPTLLRQILHGHFTGSDFTDDLCFAAYKICFTDVNLELFSFDTVFLDSELLFQVI